MSIYCFFDFFSRLLITKALMECEKLAGRSTTSMKKIVSNAHFVVPFKKDESCIQFEITAETFLTAKKPIPAIMDTNALAANVELPDLSPLSFTISMPKENIYNFRDVYRKQKENKIQF